MKSKKYWSLIAKLKIWVFEKERKTHTSIFFTQKSDKNSHTQSLTKYTDYIHTLTK